jgi:hypothetical protein
LERGGQGCKKMPKGIFTPAPSFYRLTTGDRNFGPGAEFLAPEISAVSDGISAGGGGEFNVSAQISGENLWPMYCEVHHFVEVHGGKKIC